MSARFLGSVRHRRARTTEYVVRDSAGNTLHFMTKTAAMRHIERHLDGDPGAEIEEVWK